MGDKYGVAILGAGWVAGEYVKAFRDLAGLKPDAAFLDIGCGCGRVARALTGYFGAFASYQYDSIRFNSGSCTTGTNCNMYGRHVGLIGLDWTPRPIRLD